MSCKTPKYPCSHWRALNCTSCTRSGWEWQLICKSFLEIIDPDGWDRAGNFQASMDEHINLEDFIKRETRSSCMTKDELIPETYDDIRRRVCGWPSLTPEQQEARRKRMKKPPPSMFMEEMLRIRKREKTG